MSPPAVPQPLPGSIIRPRRQIRAVMAQSLREQGVGSRTAAAWRWALSGDIPSPIRQAAALGRPPGRDEVAVEARCEPRDTPPGYRPLAGPPWFSDPDSDRRSARLVLLWLTGVSDLIPLAIGDRGKYVGARLFFARTDHEIRQVRGYALDRILADPVPAHITAAQAARPWTMNPDQMNAFYLHGTLTFLMWITGDTPAGPLTGQPAAETPPGVIDLERELAALSTVVMQGRGRGHAAEPGRYPPPQFGEGIEAAARWLTGEDTSPPVDHHGCGAYYPCPGDRRCACEAAGHCLHGRCPVCAAQPCSL